MSEPFDEDGPNPWRTGSSQVVYDNGRLRLREDSVIQPDGEPGTYAYLELPHPVVGVVPISDDQQVYLVRQWRYPWQRNSWEIPAGHAESGESVLEASQRELAEEVGLQASRWEPLGTGYSSATLTARYYLFLASGLSPITSNHRREGAEEDLIARCVPVQEAVAAALDGRIQHSMSIVGLLRAARRLGV